MMHDNEHLEQSESDSAESKHSTNVILLTPLSSSFPGSICVDRGLWRPLSAWLQGVRGDRRHLLWANLSLG